MNCTNVCPDMVMEVFQDQAANTVVLGCWHWWEEVPDTDSMSGSARDGRGVLVGREPEGASGDLPGCGPGAQLGQQVVQELVGGPHVQSDPAPRGKR